MTEEEKAKAIDKLKANSTLIRHVNCSDQGFVATFEHLGKIRVRIPDSVKNKILNIIYAEYQKEIEDLEKLSCSEEDKAEIIFTWEEAMAKHRKDIINESMVLPK